MTMALILCQRWNNEQMALILWYCANKWSTQQVIVEKTRLSLEPAFYECYTFDIEEI